MPPSDVVEPGGPTGPTIDPSADPSPDPMPQPPEPPPLEACCGSGCVECVFDLHDLAMDRYRQALRAWRARHPQIPPTRG